MMKKFLASMLMMASITAASEAAPMSSYMKAERPESAVQVPFRTDAQNFLQPSKLTNSILGTKYNQISTGNYFRTSSYAMNNAYTNPFVYEPHSGYLFAVNRIGGEANGTLAYFYSSDMGSTWNGPNVVSATENEWPFFVSYGVTNPKKTKNLADMKFVFVAPTYELESAGSTSLKFKSCMYYLVNNITDITSAEKADFTGPSLNNPGARLIWSLTGMATFNDDASSYFYTYGTLGNLSNAYYGNYGFSAATISNEGEVDVPTSTVPAAWSIDNFKLTDNPASTSYNDFINVDADPAGNLYGVVNNIFVNDDFRTLAVSKSTDKGATWSTFDKCPTSVIENYVLAQNANLDFNHSLTVYQGNGFAATGNDEFSILGKLTHWTADTVNTTEYVEIYKKNGTWGIRRAGLGTNYYLRTFTLGKTSASGDWDTPIYDKKDRESELQLAKTADGQYLIAKWIENVAVTPTEDPLEINVRNEQTEDDEYDIKTYTDSTLLVTDVFMAYRKINETEWTAINVTNDTNIYNKCTFIPKVVPSITQVPLFSLTTGTISTDSPYSSFPPLAKQLVEDAAQILTFTKVDLTNPSGVNEDNANSNLSISGITPNPATSSATINFNVETPGVATVKVFNVMGQEVASLFNSYVGNGNFTTTFDATKVNEGTYYVTLVINGKSTTKVLNVVR